MDSMEPIKFKKYGLELMNFQIESLEIRRFAKEIIAILTWIQDLGTRQL